MTYVCSSDPQFKNAESPFTELFSLLKWHENLPQEFSSSAHEAKELTVMQQHIDNAMDVLLQGLQDLGNLISMAAQAENNVLSDLDNIGFFIATISNLTEALKNLRSDTSYVLEKQKS